MSSGLRTLQKRILRRKGYSRQTQVVQFNDITKQPEIIKLKPGQGHIIAPDGTDTKSSHWPTHA
jgi:hypothetical protein